MLAFLESVWIVILSLLTGLIFPFNLAVDAIKTEISKNGVEYPETSATEKAEYQLNDCVVGEYDIFVSENGDDSAEGKIDSPLATVKAAKEKADSLNADAPVTIWFREGIYSFSQTLEFNEGDKSDVTFRSYNGEDVMFTSGEAITGFTECEVNGVKAFSKEIDRDFNILFNSETTLSRTRYPESGYFFVAKDSPEFVGEYNHTEMHNGYTGMVTKEGDFKDFYNSEDVAIRILHYWKDEMLTVKSFDEATNTVMFSRLSSMSVYENHKYFLENVFEALNTPGEWYLDKKEGKLYYIPFENESPDTLTLWGSELETMITVDGVDGIKFEDITFRGNGFNIPLNNKGRDFTQAAFDATPCISVVNSKNFSITHCEFKDIAACAVFMGKNVQDASVKYCYFENIGAHAVFIKGENLPVENQTVTRDIDITDNHIYKFGRVFYNAVGILAIHANSVNVCHNEIHDGFYTAISVGWVWGFAYSVTYNNKICDNLIYDIGQGWLSDMGGIYTLGIQRGTEISGNVIYNVAADPLEGGYGGWGIYLDEGSSYILVKNNLVYSCGNQSFHQHYGENNIVTNNIFALSKTSQIIVTKNEGRTEMYLTGNIIVSDKQGMYSRVEPGKFVDDRNLYWDYTMLSNVISFEHDSWEFDEMYGTKAMELKGYMHNGVYMDPLFKDAKNFDFTLPVNSEACEAIGFTPFDYSTAGTTVKI
ncbi:MAG: right-handed parallel beta-helix repeat-containing protein [Clostridia bacterium]|nr:right-handed parallel beta-helix repeat-containing protein [Clostridia bacterium]